MKVLLLVLSSLFVAIAQDTYVERVFGEWDKFKDQFNKTYDSDGEEMFRMLVYMQNMRKIDYHNNRFRRGEVSYELGMNHYGDLLHSEFVSKMNGFKTNRSLLFGEYNESFQYNPSQNITVPEFVDWRDEEGAVTNVGDQGMCGSCWAFSATGALEGQLWRVHKKSVSLSEQNLVDCTWKYGNSGCEGGTMNYAFEYVKDNMGIDHESAYPYEGHHEKCRYNPQQRGAIDIGYVDIPKGDEEKLKIAVATVGPISVAIDASHRSFQFYKSGVYHPESCSSIKLDHGVLVVGYGTTEKGEDYWLVKNSWSQKWGEKGYIRMPRNKDNECGIATQASFPVV